MARDEDDSKFPEKDGASSRRPRSTRTSWLESLASAVDSTKPPHVEPRRPQSKRPQHAFIADTSESDTDRRRSDSPPPSTRLQRDDGPRISRLQSDLQRERNQVVHLTRRVGELRQQLERAVVGERHKEDAMLDQAAKLKATKAELENMRGLAATITKVLEGERATRQEEREEYEADARRLRLDLTAARETCRLVAPYVEDRTTPRWLLMLQLVGDYPNAPVPRQPVGIMGQNVSLRSLNKSMLDVPISMQQAVEFIQMIKEPKGMDRLKREVGWRVCRECNVPKLIVRRTNNAAPGNSLNITEFPNIPRRLLSGENDLCTKCCLEMLEEEVARHAFGLVSKLFANVRQTGDISIVLRALEDQDSERHAAMFEVSQTLRNTLLSYDWDLPEETLARAHQFYRYLVRSGYMYPFFDDRFRVDVPDDCGRTRPFRAGTVQLVDLDSAVQVPVFLKFFKRIERPTQCVVCSEKVWELDLEGTFSRSARSHRPSRLTNSPLQLPTRERASGTKVEMSYEKDAVDSQETGRAEVIQEGPKIDANSDSPFGKEWMWKLLYFPARQFLSGCDHELNVCRKCLASHLESELQRLGRAGCDELSCPRLDCRRRFEYEEIHLLANRDTFDTLVFAPC